MKHSTRGTTVSVSAVLLGSGAAASLVAASSTLAAGAGSTLKDPPNTLVIEGLVRDFREANVEGGHPDMERYPCEGFGHYINMVEDDLDDDGKPAFRSTGCLVYEQCTDANGNAIIAPRDYIEQYAGDRMGSWECFGGDVDQDHECDGEHDVLISGLINLNPNNSDNNQFEMVLPNGDVIDRDDLHRWGEDYEGVAVSAFVMPKGNGNQNGLVVDGEPYPLQNGAQYMISAPEMRVHLYNDHRNRRGKAMGKWWLRIHDSEGATISEDVDCHSGAGVDDGCDSPFPGGGASYAPDEFAQWYRDVPGVNLSMPVSITLQRDPATGIYIFDDSLDPMYEDLSGFFPINNELYGNSAGNDRNYHFTYEARTTFVHHADREDFFTFHGDDDLWIFVDGKLVIDVGGIHVPVRQTIDFSRLGWLEDGEEYELAIFFAERHRVHSHLRIETSLDLRSVEPPVASALYD